MATVWNIFFVMTVTDEIHMWNLYDDVLQTLVLVVLGALNLFF
jgi:hypothetical protein